MSLERGKNGRYVHVFCSTSVCCTKYRLNALMKLPFHTICELTDMFEYIQHQKLTWISQFYNLLKKYDKHINKYEFIIMCRKSKSNRTMGRSMVSDTIKSGEILDILKIENLKIEY